MWHNGGGFQSRLVFRLKSRAFLHIRQDYAAFSLSARQPMRKRWIWMTIDQLNKPFSVFYRHRTNNAIGPEVWNVSCLLSSTNQGLFISDHYLPSSCCDWWKRESLVTLGLFWWVHTCLEKELTYDRNHCFQQQIFGAYVDVNSGKVTGTSTGEILWEEVCVRERELGCQVPFGVQIRMEDCILGSDALKWKNTLDSCTWLSYLHKWRDL